MLEEVVKKANDWKSSGIDQETIAQIDSLLEKGGDDLIDAFYKDLEFGTGGLRGIMGTGSNRMNKYTIGKATQGLSNYLNTTYPNEEISVAIAHDSRNNSRYFAEVTANVFSSNGIKVYLFDDLRPTPELSFTIRHFGCKSGVVLTASHNPKEYNGYKAYGDDGAQLTSPHDTNVIAEVNKITNMGSIKFDGNPDLIEIIGTEIDNLYLNMIAGLSLSPEINQSQSDLKIVYSPIHGTGRELVPKALRVLGFKSVTTVEEQMVADGNFPTVVYPNPEESEALTMALDKAREIDADLVMATDPDADRVGIAVKNLDGEFELLNGNQTGVLLVHYLIDRWMANGLIKGNEFVVKTIVTSEMIKVIADDHSIPCYDTLTGFKYIATMIRELEGQMTFIGGGEESYGYMIGDKVRDKDAVASCALIAEMTAYAKSKGKSLYEHLISLYNSYGFYYESLIAITKKGPRGAQEIQEMMSNFRENPPTHLAGSPVTTLIDYQAQTSKDLSSGEEKTVNFPASNVLQFLTEDGTKVSARPSGTEPKIKFYFGVKEELNSSDQFKKVKASLEGKIERIQKDLGF